MFGQRDGQIFPSMEAAALQSALDIPPPTQHPKTKGWGVAPWKRRPQGNSFPPALTIRWELGGTWEVNPRVQDLGGEPRSMGCGRTRG